MFTWLRNKYYARLRRIDLEILWPSCKEGCEEHMDVAKAAFAMHCFTDPAWKVLGHDGIVRFIDDLK